jgi:hypothetical protein
VTRKKITFEATRLVREVARITVEVPEELEGEFESCHQDAPWMNDALMMLDDHELNWERDDAAGYDLGTCVLVETPEKERAVLRYDPDDDVFDVLTPEGLVERPGYVRAGRHVCLICLRDRNGDIPDEGEVPFPPLPARTEFTCRDCRGLYVTPKGKSL